MNRLTAALTDQEQELLAHKLQPLTCAAEVAHNNSSLLGHLVGVWRVLRAGGASDSLANAGLLHSVYATQFFKGALFTDEQRPILSNIFGGRSEALAWKFCQIDRRDLAKQRPTGGFVNHTVVRSHESSEMISLEPDIANDLFALECANFIDQGYSGRSIGAFHAWAVKLKDHGVSLRFKCPSSHEPFAEEEEEAICLYSAASSDGADLVGLLRASALDPHAAEPLILLAAAEAVRGRFDAAVHAIEEADNRLARFGAAWDKRLSWPEWRAIADALRLTLRSRIHPQLRGRAVHPEALLEWSSAVA